MKIGKNPLMKLLKLLKNFRKKSSQIALSPVIFFLIIFGLSCEDKIPLQSVKDNILTFAEKSLSGDQLLVEKKAAKYPVGTDGSLFFGEDDNLRTCSLLKFTGMSAIPDTIDEIINSTLTLYINRALPVDTNLTDDNYVNIYLIKSVENFSWSEDDWNYTIDNPVEYDNLDKELLTTYHIGEQDTCIIDLPESLIHFWTDSLHAEGGILLEGDSRNNGRFQRLYSTNNTSLAPVIHTEYILEADTISKYYIPTDDVSFSIEKNGAESRDFLSVSEMYGEALFIKFDVADMLDNPDSNIYIPEARLKLHIDKEKSENWQDYLYLNYTIVDTNEYYPEYIYDNQSPYDYILIAKEDSSVVLNLRSPVQHYTTSGLENYGILLWMRPVSHDMAFLSFYDKTALQGLKPELRVLFAKEER
jgi:hypothetical protein